MTDHPAHSRLVLRATPAQVLAAYVQDRETIPSPHPQPLLPHDGPFAPLAMRWLRSSPVPPAAWKSSPITSAKIPPSAQPTMPCPAHLAAPPLLKTLRSC